MAGQASTAAGRSKRRTRDSMKSDLLTAAMRLLEAEGPSALQARTVATAAGTSTQSLYTVFGGTPGLLEALVAHGFRDFGSTVGSVPETEDPVADHFAKGWTYCDWAFAHPQLYRLMFGLTGGALSPHTGVEQAVGGALKTFPDGRAAMRVMTRSIERIITSGRVPPADVAAIAGQFLSATHGMVLLTIAGEFDKEMGLHVLGELAVTLFIGLGDKPARVHRSLESAIRTRFPDI